MPNDPTPEIYAIMDKVGLRASTFYNSRKSMDTIVNEMRTKLVNEITDYIERRENGRA